MKMKLLPFLSLIFLFACTRKEQTGTFVRDVDEPIIKLDGAWKITLNPSSDFFNGEQEGERWSEILVPGEAMMQGFPVKYDKPFV